MEKFSLNQFALILPEIILVMSAMAGQMISLFNFSKNNLINIYIIAIIIVAYFMLNLFGFEGNGFHETFYINKKISSFKILILFFVVATILIYKDYCDISNSEIKVEFITLLLLSTTGIFISLSSQNFLLLFCGLELQALPSYALTAFNINNYKSSESALKYFILGAIATCIMLLGISYIYGFSGSLKFCQIREILLSAPGSNIGLITGLILMLSAIFFKLSAAPMHIWAPDVYEGAPISIIGFFSTAQKISMIVVLINIVDLAIGRYQPIAESLIRIIAILSMLVGAFGAINQRSIKRLMAYSTILNVGFAMIGVVLGNDKGDYASLLHITIYSFSTIGLFACLIALFGDKSEDVTFNDLKAVASTRKAAAGSIMIIMFSMIGIPPLAGFFGKYYLFYQALQSAEYSLLVLGIISSLISAYYYLKIIKYMYFIESEVEVSRIPGRLGLTLVVYVSIGVIILFSLFVNKYLYFIN